MGRVQPNPSTSWLEGSSRIVGERDAGIARGLMDALDARASVSIEPPGELAPGHARRVDDHREGQEGAHDRTGSRSTGLRRFGQDESDLIFLFDPRAGEIELADEVGTMRPGVAPIRLVEHGVVEVLSHDPEVQAELGHSDEVKLTDMPAVHAHTNAYFIEELVGQGGGDRLHRHGRNLIFQHSDLIRASSALESG